MGKKVIIKTPEENIVSLLDGKKVLFLERDGSLQDGLDEFENILKRAKIKHTLMFNISESKMDKITKAINDHDAIVFMTQWVYEISTRLHKYVSSLPDKKIIIEVFVSEPTWYYKKQHGTKHDVYVYSCPTHFGEPDKSDEEFYKLSNKPYWEYKNKFDK